jgi:hypothetical protein
MKIETGTPAEDGRYVVFVQCASGQIREWCEPIIAAWHGGRWHFAGNAYVLGWSGPIPPLKIDALKAQEYDL